MKLKARSVFKFVPMAVVMGAIYILSAQPGDTMSLPQLPGLDKLAHMAIYGVLALAILFSFNKPTQKSDLKRVLLVTVSCCLVYGISDEFHQSFVPGRTPSVFDLLADCIGAFLACLLYLLWRERRCNPMTR